MTVFGLFIKFRSKRNLIHFLFWILFVYLLLSITHTLLLYSIVYIMFLKTLFSFPLCRAEAANRTDMVYIKSVCTLSREFIYNFLNFVLFWGILLFQHKMTFNMGDLPLIAINLFVSVRVFWKKAVKRHISELGKKRVTTPWPPHSFHREILIGTPRARTPPPWGM